MRFDYLLSLPIFNDMTPIQAKSKAYYEANKERLRAKSLAWYWANRSTSLARVQAWREANPERKVAHSRKLNLTREYGTDTPEIYAKLVKAQHGRCAICHKLPQEGKHLDVDHCHTDKTVRGLLCNPCNRGLAAFRDDPHRMRAAIRYLER